jgi:hypothetical protein
VISSHFSIFNIFFAFFNDYIQHTSLFHFMAVSSAETERAKFAWLELSLKSVMVCAGNIS